MTPRTPKRAAELAPVARRAKPDLAAAAAGRQPLPGRSLPRITRSGAGLLSSLAAERTAGRGDTVPGDRGSGPCNHACRPGPGTGTRPGPGRS